MGQDFRIIQCVQCKLFQVCQVRRAKKWQCKCCGTRQSVMKVFKEGSARDLRTVVQKMNMELGNTIAPASSASGGGGGGEEPLIISDQNNAFNPMDTVASLRKGIDGAGVAEAMSQVDIDDLNSFLLFGVQRTDGEKPVWCDQTSDQTSVKDQCTSQKYLDEIFGSDQLIEENSKAEKKKKKQSKWNEYVENTKQ